MSGGTELYSYKEWPKTCDPEDFWSQVKRTVNGTPVPEEQIQMIVDALLGGLNLQRDDTLLDLCCGNGALTARLFAYCSGGLGVDFSEYLIDVACKHFVLEESHRFQLQDVVEFAASYEHPQEFTKGYCYGSFTYLDREQAEELLLLLRKRFMNVDRLFIGNLPDRDLLEEFFFNRLYTQGMEDDPGSPIGIWRNIKEFTELARRTGWMARISRMPADFYAAGYRYDAMLMPQGR